MKRAMEFFKSLVFSKNGYIPAMVILLVAEILLCPFVIQKVKYTEIDWVAYMQEVEHFLNGTLDYDRIEGQTGPCVYPAGFLYIYSLLYKITGAGADIKLGQYIFNFLYIMTLLLVFNIYRISVKVPPYALAFMCIISYRIHSIYILRLFNDPLAMIAVYASINALLYGRFTLASILISIGVSIKMNVLLFFPGLLLVLLFHRGILQTTGHLCEIGIVQLVLGAPFLFHNAEAYVTRAFNFGRQFMYQWTVNWRIIPEYVFLDRRFHRLLLGLQLFFLAVILFRFIRSHGGLTNFLSLHEPKRPTRLEPSTIIYPMFVCNFIGVAFSRSLHYQFYVWYFHTLLYLLWSCDRFSSPVRLLLFGLIELCWNTYPSTVYSSGLLHACHLVLLIGLLLRTHGYHKPVVAATSQPSKRPVKTAPSKSHQKHGKPKQA